MNITQYLAQLDTRFKSGISRENSYRADLESLIRELVQGVEITNEPANVTDCGNPDYVITRKKIPIGYIEAKDIDKDLKNKTYKEQFDRYKKALDNLVLTNYLWFQFFQGGELVHEIRIGEIEGNKIIPLTENFAQFETLIRDFCTFVGQTIKSSKKLAEMMAAKARLLENILERAVTSDEETHEDSSLKSQFETFKNILIHDLTPKGFADIYAQTLAYGMFAARLHDPSLQDFSRQEAAELIPKTNPFLRKLFQYVAGYDIDQRIKTTVDNLAEVFRATDVNALLSNFGKSTQANDPIIHFYETFLTEYDPKLRKSRGVWYTPEPVVKFIVRAVDDILKTEFNLPDGLADTSKTKIKIKDFAKATADMRSKTKQIEREVEVHKVQILDPATGTGTFLAEVVKHIYSTRFQAMQGAWSGYVEEHLIPRLNGFEILMASYSMAHLKLDMLLTETGYKPKREQRFNIYLTNSLEEHHPDTGTLFANWLSSEANEANYIKRDTPVMCVIGNPPYSVSSSNKSEWIENLTADYKKDLNERNIQPLSDDYIKFIRFGQYFIEKNGEGILAYISNNSFIDGLIHRQMRKNLMETFDKIYILDLHGNSKKKETAPDGGKDENVFDIMQGVSINIFVKKRK
jgi:type I restriction-modification system DNA methylase subunit